MCVCVGGGGWCGVGLLGSYLQGLLLDLLADYFEFACIFADRLA